MKSLSSLLILIICSQFLQAQGRIGINTTTPQALLHVKDSSVLFTGSVLGTGNPPVSGAGIRFMWYAPKAAFRCGESDNVEWNKDSIGNHSFAAGKQVKAKGVYSIAMGFNASAKDDYSVALGRQLVADGVGATAIGYGCQALALGSFAANYFSTAQGSYSTAMGFSTQSNGQMSISTGYDTEAEGIVSIAGGYRSQALGSYSAALGFQSSSKPFASFVIGRYNNDSVGDPETWVATDPLFMIGIGSDLSSKHNAFTVLKNGKTGINEDHPLSTLHVKGVSGGENNHLILEDNNATESAKIYYTGDLYLKNTRVGGDFYFRSYENINILKLFSTGNMEIAGTLTQNSDARLKRDFSPLGSPLSKVTALKGYHYYWSDKSRDTSLQTGFIAQEIEAIMPELVTTAADGTKSVNYIGVIPYLAESIKELKKENEELRKMLKELLNK